MNYVFIDESGDLGFSKNSSKWFIFTIALTDDFRKLEKIIKKARKSLFKKDKKVSELHSYHSNEITRKRILNELNKIDNLKILCVVLNKEKVYVDLQNQKNYLYNYTANILLDRLHNKNLIDIKESIQIYFDKKDTNKNIRLNFEKYIKESLQSKREGKVSVELMASYDSKSIQAVDFISWSIFRKYERGDFQYYDLIKGKIVEENLLFP
jgi:hypothetical protein